MSTDLESAEHSGDPPLQGVPALVPFVDHNLEFTGGVGAVFTSQTSVLFIHQLELSQTLVDPPLKRLRIKRKHRRGVELESA